jgi:hypothetical protein
MAKMFSSVRVAVSARSSAVAIQVTGLDATTAGQLEWTVVTSLE